MAEFSLKNLNTKQAVLATLAYFDLFGIPLSRSEISEYFLFAEPDEKKIDIYLRESPLIHEFDGFYSIQGDEQFYRNFFEKKSRAKKFWKRVRRYQWIFAICPFIEMVAVCNSLPISNVNKDSDIDLLVVTEAKHMFVARYCLTLLTSILRLRRHGKKTRKRFCLSFYLSETKLNLEQIKLEGDDLYLAYWLKTLKPIAGKHRVYRKLIEENQVWLGQYFNSPSDSRRRFRRRNKLQRRVKKTLEFFLGSERREIKQMNWQLSRAREKYIKLNDKRGTIIKEDILKFHDNDKREEIANAWKLRLKGLL
jgi:hypothetical protein